MRRRKRGRRLERASPPHYIGDELVVAGILSGLPAKSLLRFRCVCKSWLSLISSPNFISSQLRNSRTNHTQLVMHQLDELIRPHRPTAVRLFHLEDDLYQPMLLNFGIEPAHGNLHLVGSVGGLICYYAVQGDGDLLSKFIIFNPEIRSFLSVPPPLPVQEFTSMDILTGFGFNDATLDYQIFLAASNLYVYLYSLNNNSWKFISCQFSWCTRFGYCAIFAEDCFHWLIDVDEDHHTHSLPSIMVFDIKSENFRWILLPEHFTGGLSITPGFGESCIGIVQVLSRPRSTLTHVWLMYQNGSWSKVADDVLLVKRNEAKQVLGFRNKDELFIRDYSRGRVIVSQHINTGMVRDVVSKEVLLDLLSAKAQGRFRYSVHTHVPNLTLLDKIIG